VREPRILLIFGVLVLSWIVLPLVGGIPITLQALLSEQSPEIRQIYFELRLPRIILGSIVGASLAVAGLVFQSLFRNPLASPYTLGIASGSAFGVALFVKLSIGVPLLVGFSVMSLGALFGAGLTLLVLLLFIKRNVSQRSLELLLIGVMLSFFFSSLVMFVQYLSDFTEVYRISRWLMGSLSTVGYFETLVVLLVSLPLWVYIYSHRRALDLLLFGDEFAHARGVETTQVPRNLLLATSFLVAIIVAVTGPIGFVGIIVPHLCRFLVGERHEILIFASILVGGVFLPLCDTFARVVVSPFELPVGLVTALLGGPFFLGLLLFKRRG